jgi:hypothetical protein
MSSEPLPRTEGARHAITQRADADGVDAAIVERDYISPTSSPNSIGPRQKTEGAWSSWEPVSKASTSSGSTEGNALTEKVR